MDQEEKQRHHELAQKLLSEQNFPVAVIAGVVAMAVAAGIYAAITVAAGGVSYGLMATGIGVVIGFAIQFLGRGIGSKFAVLASVLAVAGCLLGNLLAVVLLVAKANAMSPLDLLVNMDLVGISEIIVADLQFADLLFWILAIAAAAYFAKRKLTHEEGLALHTYEMRSIQ
ncbi:MAG: hypothetical protein AAFX56_04975 [Pseudomonadota bacterium]